METMGSVSFTTFTVKWKLLFTVYCGLKNVETKTYHGLHGALIGVKAVCEMNIETGNFKPALFLN